MQPAVPNGFTHTALDLGAQRVRRASVNRQEKLENWSALSGHYWTRLAYHFNSNFNLMSQMPTAGDPPAQAADRASTADTKPRAALARGSRRCVALRMGLVALAVPNTLVGGWLLFAPHSFYKSFPGLGLHWVQPLGGYSQHAFSDFGGALLAIALLAWLASVWLERRLAQAALLTVLCESLSHFAYHLTRLSALSVTDAIVNQLSLAYAVVLSILLLVLIQRIDWARRGVREPTN